jgi:hypothetical protein
MLSCLTGFAGEACASSAQPFLRIIKRKKMLADFFQVIFYF